MVLLQSWQMAKTWQEWRLRLPALGDARAMEIEN